MGTRKYWSLTDHKISHQPIEPIHIFSGSRVLWGVSLIILHLLPVLAQKLDRRGRTHKEAMKQALINNPAHITRSPIYISDRAQFDPKTGSLSPTEKIHECSLRLHELYEAAYDTLDYESYLLVGHLAEWLLENARYAYASSTGYQRALNFANERTISLGARFRGERSKKVPLVPLRVAGTRSSYTLTPREPEKSSCASRFPGFCSFA